MEPEPDPEPEMEHQPRYHEVWLGSIPSGTSETALTAALMMASAGGGVGAADSAGMRSAIGRTASSIAVQYGE